MKPGDLETTGEFVYDENAEMFDTGIRQLSSQMQKSHAAKTPPFEVNEIVGFRLDPLDMNIVEELYLAEDYTGRWVWKCTTVKLKDDGTHGSKLYGSPADMFVRLTHEILHPIRGKSVGKKIGIL